MDYATLAPGLPPSSRLGFGCGGVMGRVGRSRSVRSIHAALDAGITHFDVAPLYGYGDAEALLGAALAGRRERVVVASKFGLEPPRAAATLRALKPLAQRVAASLPGARSVLRSLAGGARQAPDRFSPAAAADSLGRSLARLHTDYLDILFLHDCAAADLTDEVGEFLDRQLAAGTIRAYGVATDIDTVLALHRIHGDRLVYQFANGLFACNAERLGAGARIVAHSPFFAAERLRGLVAPGDIHALMLSHALAAPEVGVVLCSMLDLPHLAANLAVVERPRPAAEELAAALLMPAA